MFPYNLKNLVNQTDAPKSQYSFKQRPDLNKLMTFIFLCILLSIIIFISKQIMKEGFRSYRFEKRSTLAALQESKNNAAYKFLTRAAYQYYRNGEYHNALFELRLAHKIYPTRYRSNYVNTITLIALCKQRGIYCDEAIESLEYLNDNWHLDAEWVQDQELTLGIL